MQYCCLPLILRYFMVNAIHVLQSSHINRWNISYFAKWRNLFSSCEGIFRPPSLQNSCNFKNMNRVQYDNRCSAGNFSTQLTVSISLIMLIFFSFNTDSRVNKHAEVCRYLQKAWSESKLYWLEEELPHLIGNRIDLKCWTQLPLPNTITRFHGHD